jgi:hypothetical protein
MGGTKRKWHGVVDVADARHNRGIGMSDPEIGRIGQRHRRPLAGLWTDLRCKQRRDLGGTAIRRTAVATQDI